MICGYAQNGRLDEAQVLFDSFADLFTNLFSPTQSTYCKALFTSFLYIICINEQSSEKALKKEESSEEGRTKLNRKLSSPPSSGKLILSSPPSVCFS
ncbi:hypothetical protein LOK49_LG07G01475 [Camellia lanceoleosa]|uniref:Uncharacterized protein n=1 Tax=Camellia lanceoleosa TaxID=1840588 RepID=A0ACC0GZU2_9ERIC|nr:hypothetical protein LOK49_LG07G01475 [Camellia lanceoleosa]